MKDTDAGEYKSFPKTLGIIGGEITGHGTSTRVFLLFSLFTSRHLSSKVLGAFISTGKCDTPNLICMTKNILISCRRD